MSLVFSILFGCVFLLIAGSFVFVLLKSIGSLRKTNLGRKYFAGLNLGFCSLVSVSVLASATSAGGSVDGQKLLAAAAVYVIPSILFYGQAIVAAWFFTAGAGFGRKCFIAFSLSLALLAVFSASWLEYSLGAVFALYLGALLLWLVSVIINVIQFCKFVDPGVQGCSEHPVSMKLEALPAELSPGRIPILVLWLLSCGGWFVLVFLVNLDATVGSVGKHAGG